MLRYSFICGLFAVCLCLGCSRNNPKIEKTVPVRGTVAYENGSPLTSGLITFHPKDTTKGEARGAIGSDGRFELGTYGKSDGVMLGTYTVTVEAITYDRSGNLTPAPVRIPNKYTDTSTSDLTVEVKEEGDQDMKIVLK
jgi:hypothetical protein